MRLPRPDKSCLAMTHKEGASTDTLFLSLRGTPSPCHCEAHSPPVIARHDSAEAISGGAMRLPRTFQVLAMTKGKGLNMTNRNYQAISPCAAFTRDVYSHIIIR